MIGRFLAEEFLRENIEVLALIRPNSTRTEDLPKNPNYHVVSCDISQMAEFSKRIDARDQLGIPKGSYDAFFHLGWGGTFGMSRNDVSRQMDNINYTLDAVNLGSALGCSIFVGAGSQAEYGRCDVDIAPDNQMFPESAYGVAKLAAGQASRLLCSQKGMKHIWMRILSVYGPYDGINTMVSMVIKELLAGRTPALTTCEQIWDYLYVSDAAHALRLAAEKGLDGSTYCLGSGVGRSLCEFVETIRDIVDPTLTVGIGQIPYGPKQVMRLVANIDSLRNDTGFEPKVSFDEGIRRTIEWMEYRALSASLKDEDI